jgi:hypothetical protein
VPADSRGAQGDIAGSIAIDENYFYVCTQNYSAENYNSNVNIWKRVSYENATWY